MYIVNKGLASIVIKNFHKLPQKTMIRHFIEGKIQWLMHIGKDA